VERPRVHDTGAHSLVVVLIIRVCHEYGPAPPFIFHRSIPLDKVPWYCMLVDAPYAHGKKASLPKAKHLPRSKKLTHSWRNKKKLELDQREEINTKN
jgi:hypothetical protein